LKGRSRGVMLFEALATSLAVVQKLT
jgi:hypothetical protein